MQAGLVDGKLRLRDVFAAGAGFVLSAAMLLGVRWKSQRVTARVTGT